MNDMICCIPRSLPSYLHEHAARFAWTLNPANRPADVTGIGDRQRIVMTTKWWGSSGVHLTVQFLDVSDENLKARILGHMNAWSKTANVSFSEASGTGQVRIATIPGSGHWSYLGTDILSIPQGDPTMNLDSFSMDTPESEFFRVVRHETGHTLGCPHEHLRAEIISRINMHEAYQYFRLYDSWSRQDVDYQVLTPIEQSSILQATPQADSRSIMCYQLPGSIMRDHVPVPGGGDIDQSDYDLMALIYPKRTNV